MACFASAASQGLPEAAVRHAPLILLREGTPLFEAQSHAVQLEAEAAQDAPNEAARLTQQAEQQLLGADVRAAGAGALVGGTLPRTAGRSIGQRQPVRPPVVYL